ncbi:MAG: primosomal protein N' [Proteobacteria bacterium]|nr:primosomal protein N' [Pseudomonadota bacterium]
MIVHVALSIPIAKTFSYSVPEKWESFIKPFSRVAVPFHNRTLTGFIVDIEEKDDAGLKAISDIIDIFPLIDDKIIRLCEWASRYYVTPIGMVLKFVLPQTLKIENYISIRSLESCTSALEGVPLKKAYKNPGKDAIIQSFQNGLIEFRDSFTGKIFAPSRKTYGGDGAFEKKLYIGDIESRIAYYMKCISEYISEGKNVLMLLPDYNSAGVFYHKAFIEKFKNNVIWYGSAIKTKTRMDAYFKARNEKGFLILGNKSCIFLPILNLSLIIVERQEEDEYRNEEGFNFNANMLALRLAESEHIPIVFGSASPSMEMFKYGEEGRFTVIGKEQQIDRKYSVVLMDKSLAAQADLPDKLVAVIKGAVQQNENIAVFTPRRGYISHIQCLECKRTFLCPFCEGLLGLNKQDSVLVCGNCNKSFTYEDKCVYCGSNLIRPYNIGTEYIEEKLKTLFQDSHIVNITAETIKKFRKTMSDISDSRRLILVGTQSLSKIYGMHTNKLIFVGWEELVRMAGYRSEEKMFQIFMNLLDILKPEEIYFFMDKKLAVNPARFFGLEKFYTEELKKRKAAEFPPYVRFFLIDVEKKEEKTGLRILDKINNILEQEGLIEHVTGPMKEKRKGFYKWKLILKGDEMLLQKALLSIYGLPGVHIEADPMNI